MENQTYNAKNSVVVFGDATTGAGRLRRHRGNRQDPPSGRPPSPVPVSPPPGPGEPCDCPSPDTAGAGGGCGGAMELGNRVGKQRWRQERSHPMGSGVPSIGLRRGRKGEGQGESGWIPWGNGDCCSVFFFFGGFLGGLCLFWFFWATPLPRFFSFVLLCKLIFTIFYIYVEILECFFFLHDISLVFLFFFFL